MTTRTTISILFAGLLALAGCQQQAQGQPPASTSPQAQARQPLGKPSLARQPQLQQPQARQPAAPTVDANAAAPKQATVTVKVFFLDQERMKTGEEPMFVPVERQVPSQDPALGALGALFAGPNDQEKGRGLRFVSSGATGFSSLSVENGIARVQLEGKCSSGGSTATIAQELYPTLKQFPQIKAVKIYDAAGKTEQPEGERDSIPTCLEP